MVFCRRDVLRLGIGAATVPLLPRPAAAQRYPARPVRMITGFAAGGPGDILMRLVGQRLSEQLGQPFVVENRTGAGGNLATEAVVRSPPDGHTLLQIGPANTINAALNDKLTFSFIRDIAPVASIVRLPHVIVVNASVPVATVPELIAYAKANPAKLNMGSAGIGSASQMVGELFKMMTGVNMVHVPYRGLPLAFTDLLGGQVQVLFDSMANVVPHIKSGKVRALAVTTAERSEILPELPTVAEFVPGYDASSVYGLGGPRNMPENIVGKLNEEINAAVADPTVKARLAELGGTALPGSPGDFGRLLADETQKWAQVIRFAGIKGE